MNDDEVYDDMYNPSLEFPATRWYKWFAWHPVNVKGKKVWLQYVYRTKKLRALGIQNVRQVWVYGDIFDVLKA